MKKLISAIMAAVMVFSVFGTTAFASQEESSSTVEYYDDGSYLVTEVVESGISTFAASTKTYNKVATYYSESNVKQWSVKLTANFSYTGSSATCTSATTSYTIYDSHWKVTAAKASRSGNKATGTFTVKKYVLGVPVKTVNKTLTITCSNTGVCS